MLSTKFHRMILYTSKIVNYLQEILIVKFNSKQFLLLYTLNKKSCFHNWGFFGDESKIK